jgi:thiamine-phosphate pyrophosphorylase
MAFSKLIKWLTGRSGENAAGSATPQATAPAGTNNTGNDDAVDDIARRERLNKNEREFRGNRNDTSERSERSGDRQRGGRDRDRNGRGNRFGDRDRNRNRGPRHSRDDFAGDDAPDAEPLPIPAELLPAPGQPFSVVITDAEEFPDEERLAVELLEAGLTRFHLRKRGWSLGKFFRWIDNVPAEYHNRIVLHAEPRVVRERHLGGLHVRSNDRRPRGWPADIPVSHSCHSFQNLSNFARKSAYATIGPVFASISKQGYEPQRTVEEYAEILKQWKELPSDVPLLALGGITFENINQVRTLGFDGFAVVGSIWGAEDPIAAFKTLQENWHH